MSVAWRFRFYTAGHAYQAEIERIDINVNVKVTADNMDNDDKTMGLTKRKLVRALVDVWARAVGCWWTYLRMMDQDEDGDEKRMGGTKVIVRWLEANGARILCALNVRYMKRHSS